METEGIIRKIETAKDDPLDILEVARNCLGLKYLSYFAVNFTKPGSGDLPIHATNYPREWQIRYLNQDYAKIDPAFDRRVPEHCSS